MMREPRDSEGGFTLIELLMTVVILAIIIVPLSASLIVGLRTSDNTVNRLASSRDAQFVSLYLTPDVQSAGLAASDVVVGGGNTQCSGVANTLLLNWSASEATFNGSPTNYKAAYAIVQNRLTRFYCVNDILTSTKVVAKNLPGSSTASASISGTKVAMTVTEAPKALDSYMFTVSAVRRTTP